MANGIVLPATSLPGDLKRSPIFSKASFTSGKTQLADAMQRAQFWTTVSAKAPGYHLLLGTPNVLAAATIRVPGRGRHRLYLQRHQVRVHQLFMVVNKAPERHQRARLLGHDAAVHHFRQHVPVPERQPVGLLRLRISRVVQLGFG